ncbi:phage tail protein, partial [Enterovibrio norvegicus]|uniref:NlpC/P60 family protein n=1 Tax=Enterovibrio norvegicus TaxID=188144 RepID=UPI000368279E
PAVLSEADRKSQRDTDLTWWLVVGDAVHTFRPVAPLIGRTFDHGTVDCYTLFRDAYALAGFDFPDFERPHDWWEGERELYLDNMAQHGFVRVETPEPGDVILMQLKSDRANHAAVYLGDMKIVHHLPGRLSGRDLYGGYWQRHTHSIWRHQQWQPSAFMGICNDLAAFSA